MPGIRDAPPKGGEKKQGVCLVARREGVCPSSPLARLWLMMHSSADGWTDAPHDVWGALWLAAWAGPPSLGLTPP